MGSNDNDSRFIYLFGAFYHNSPSFRKGVCNESVMYYLSVEVYSSLPSYFSTYFISLFKSLLHTFTES